MNFSFDFIFKDISLVKGMTQNILLDANKTFPIDYSFTDSSQRGIMWAKYKSFN